MYTKATLVSAILAVAEARFGQEQAPVAAIQALTNFGNPGDAGTLSGQVPSALLAAADPCDKLTLADKIVSTLGNDAQVISAAQGLVAAEQNFNPFSVSVPNICGDASLPATEELRGIVPLVDPDVTGSDTENANSDTSLQTPFDAAGLSVADIMTAQGFSNFTVNGAAASGNDNAGSNTGNADSSNSGNTGSNSGSDNGNASNTGNSGNSTSNTGNDSGNTGNTGNSNSGSSGSSAQDGSGAVTDAEAGNFPGFQASSLGLDFGTCTPTVKFEESLNGRKPGEFTFQAQDPVVNKGQQEALNPNIIFNRICDQLTNVCGAADDAVDACKSAQADLGSGPKDHTTADAWNEALGFAGIDINPDNAPQDGLVGHT
ncbi:hypothetical protein GGR52DRAFT_284715 [Hypoxylon sp. FL1284]|nr:hypothetical protein GGR52DRAFT_284715 [Hypoxylon sp. FL1284]